MRPGLQCSSSSLPRWRSCRSNNVQSPVSFQLPAGLTALRVQYLSSYLSPFQEERLRRFAAAVYPLLCQLWCADLRPEVVIASCQRWSNLRDIKSCVCSVQVCSVLRSLFLRIGVVYGISNFTNGVGHAEVIYGPYFVQMSISFTGGECSILMQRREDNLSSIVI